MALNESQVLAKTRSQDLISVRKFNCWGCGIKDVSLVRRLDNVEVIGLSCNEITSLEDFAHCPKLQELILRKNKISSIAELTYLQTIPNLNSLWLGENPVAENTPNYRKQVLRLLPNLKILDNIPVTREELFELDKPDVVSDQQATQIHQQQPYQHDDNQSADLHQSASLQYHQQNELDVSDVTCVDSHQNRSMSNLQDQQELLIHDMSNFSTQTNLDSTANNSVFNESYYSPSGHASQHSKFGNNKSLNSSRHSLKMSQARSLPSQASKECGQCNNQQYLNNDQYSTNGSSVNNNSLGPSKARCTDKLVSAVLLLVDELEFSECIPILDSIHSKLRDKQQQQVND